MRRNEHKLEYTHLANPKGYGVFELLYSAFLITDTTYKWTQSLWTQARTAAKEAWPIWRYTRLTHWNNYSKRWEKQAGQYVWCSRNPEFLLHITDFLHMGEKQTYTSNSCLTRTFKRMFFRVIVHPKEESVCKRRIEAVPLFILPSGINPSCRTTAYNFLQPDASREMMLEQCASSFLCYEIPVLQID